MPQLTYLRHVSTLCFPEKTRALSSFDTQAIASSSPFHPQTAIIDFSGSYSYYTGRYTSFSYENDDPLPSLGVESLYMGAVEGGCGSWFITQESISLFWDVGSVYYELTPLADSGGDDDW